MQSCWGVFGNSYFWTYPIFSCFFSSLFPFFCLHFSIGNGLCKVKVERWYIFFVNPKFIQGELEICYHMPPVSFPNTYYHRVVRFIRLRLFFLLSFGQVSSNFLDSLFIICLVWFVWLTFWFLHNRGRFWCLRSLPLMSGIFVGEKIGGIFKICLRLLGFECCSALHFFSFSFYFFWFVSRFLLYLIWIIGMVIHDL